MKTVWTMYLTRQFMGYGARSMLSAYYLHCLLSVRCLYCNCGLRVCLVDTSARHLVMSMAHLSIKGPRKELIRPPLSNLVIKLCSSATPTQKTSYWTVPLPKIVST